ncbi:WD40-repeat-containing domain protein [Sporodiniella umbellata]|nr:WD40-repeat-containing domain protein [Sporodiniella umbellata]
MKSARIAFEKASVVSERSASWSSLVPGLESPNGSRFQISPLSDVGRRILLTREYKRCLSPSPIKVLDAPELVDNFYLNLLDWGKNDLLAVGLGQEVYLWNPSTSEVTLLCQLPDGIASVSWSTGHYLAVGTLVGQTMLYDTITLSKIRTWTNHDARVSSLAWASNVLSSGGKDQCVYHHDVRSVEAYFRVLTGHRHEVCGLKWNPEGNLLASGGNDNQLIIWDGYQRKALHQFGEHTAAVKAISWSPHQRGILVSGGGTADQTLKQWNTVSGLLVSSFDTGSQVCNLLWSKKTDEIISSHGYARSEEPNKIHLWKADGYQKKGSLSGHQSRVLYMAMSQDENTLVTGAPDESLMFWDIFSKDEIILRDSKARGNLLR